MNNYLYYIPPTIEEMDFKTEKGFAQSIPGSGFHNEDYGGDV